jgi:aryl-phospho-beta-D-glucosidase BglC (GH1 family)
MKKKIELFIKFLLLIILPVIIIGYKTTQGLWRVVKKYSIVTQLDKKINIPLLPQAPKMQWLHTAGNKITNEQGENIILRGVNIASINWGVDEWNPRAVEQAITSWHAKVIRTRIYLSDFKTDKNEFFFKLEDQIVGPARKQGVYVILHNYVPFPLNKTDLPSEEMMQMWEAVARFYKDDPLILYDVIPEPHDTSWEEVRRVYGEIIPRVKRENPKALIFVSGLAWGREINPYLENPLPYDNLVYRSNPYNQPDRFEGLFGQIALKYPVFLGEFGPNQDMSQESVTEVISYANALGIGWTAWTFHSVGCPCLLTDYQTFTPSEYGNVVKEALQR